MRTTSLLMIGLMTVAANAMANELDPVAANIPDGLVVKESHDGKREVFKASLVTGAVENEAAAAAALAAVKEENKVKSVDPIDELDQVTSDDSWYYRWNSYSSYGSGYYSYGYRYCGSYYNYYPSYRYSYRSYTYTYYYTPVRYSCRSSYSYNDSYGWHYGSRYGWR